MYLYKYKQTKIVKRNVRIYFLLLCSLWKTVLSFTSKKRQF